nr:FecR domain-containing protein [uncultured Dyadobacter sp.]
MDKDRLLYLLEREKAGENSAAEEKELDDWYQYPEGRPAFTDGLSADALAALEGKMLSKIQAASNVSGLPLEVSRTSFTGYWTRIAATVSVLIMVGIGMYFFGRRNGMTVERTGFGETRVISLPDGSQVVLNGNSELSYDAAWQDLREVRLEGEAYFKVVHTRDHRRFRVRTGSDFSLDVLGTEFNVSRRKSGTRIVLNEGKVQCYLGSSAGDTLVLRPGEMVRFADKPTDYVKEHVEASAYSAWKDHKLVFNNTSLREIAALLQDTYGLETEVDQPDLLSRQISGSVPTDNVELLLEGIAEASAVSIQREGNHLTIRSQSKSK